MKTPGMVRKMDELGRIVIPHELRKILDIKSGDELELILQPEGLLLRKFPPSCVFCGEKKELLLFRGRNLCKECLQNLRRV